MHTAVRCARAVRMGLNQILCIIFILLYFDNKLCNLY